MTLATIVERLQEIASSTRGVIHTDLILQKALLSLQTSREITSWGTEHSTRPMTLGYTLVMPDHNFGDPPAVIHIEATPL